MDCCNYLPYRQPYYGGAYYDHLSYPGDFYGHPYHEYGYGSSPYYAQPWACAPPIPDYVYNPKEARIRKAMREVSRDRGLGSASMTGARNSGRRPPAWMPGPEDPLMMTPQQTMRTPMPSPMCGASFQMPPEPSPFMNGYSKLGHNIMSPSSDPINSSSSYMQTMQQNAMVNMQHQPNLWQGYQDVMTSRPSSEYILPELPSYSQQLHEPQTRENPNTPISVDIKPQIELQNFNHTPSLSAPEKLATNNERENQKLLHPDTMYETPDVEIDDTSQNIMGGENMQNAEQFLPVYNKSNNNMTGRFSSNEEIKIKKPASIKHKTTTTNNNNTSLPLKPLNKPLPDFNEAFGSTERGRFQSPPIAPNKDYLDFFFDSNAMKYSDFHI